MDRDTFLRATRTALLKSGLPPAPKTPPGGLVPDLALDGLVDRFVERLESVDAIAHQPEDGEAAVDVISGLLETYGASEFLAWEAAHLPISGLLERLPGRVLDPTVSLDGRERFEHQAAYMNVRVGVTGASAGLAESGSIVLAAGPGRPRMASLIPLVHIALLRSADISPSLSHWVAEHPEAARQTSNLVFVTGPSRTADIEQVLNLGVHGPKHLHVVLLSH